MRRLILGFVVIVLAGAGRVDAAVVLSDMPAYNWYHGCGPTAAASVFGHWDLNGYGNLFDASGWDEVRFTVNVQDQISSPEHNTRYDPDPDLDKPVYEWNSIADWFRTSVNQPYGWSWQSDADDAFIGYADYRGYQFDSWYENWSQFSWSDLVSEIDAGRPMMFLVDSDGNGGTDHFVPVFGYDDREADGLWYALYTTWSEDEKVEWQRFQGMGNDWGIGYATFVHPHAIPEPCSCALWSVAGLIGMGLSRWRNRKRT